MIPFGPRRLRGCVTSHHAALSSSRCASWLLHSLLSSSHHTLVNSSHQLVVALPLLFLSLRRPLVSSSCCASWLSHCLLPSSRCATLSSTCRASLMLHRLSLSSCCAPRRPLVLSSRRLVAVLPLNAPPSRRLIVSSSRRLVVPSLIVLSHQLVVAPSSLVILSLHRPLVLSSSWLVGALPVFAPPSCPLVVGMMQAYVGQKHLKRDILRVFTMSDL